MTKAAPSECLIPQGTRGTSTFKRIKGRWHVAQLCWDCREPTWHDVHERSFDYWGPIPYRCDDCSEERR